MTRRILLSLLFVLSLSAQAGYVGYTTYPLVTKKNLLSAGLDSVLSTGGGMGLEARYTHKINHRFILDGGLAISGADQSASRIFVGADYEIMPDYMEQPRVSLKFRWSNEDQFQSRINRVSVAPTATKGFRFWGKEAYPYVAIPVGIDFNTSTSTYKSVMNLTTGITGQLPFKGYEKVTGNVEMSLNVKDSYSTLSVGLSMPIEM